MGHRTTVLVSNKRIWEVPLASFPMVIITKTVSSWWRQKWLLLVSLLLSSYTLITAQIAEPVYPIYDSSILPSHYRNFPLPYRANISWLLEHEAVSYHPNCCLTHTNRASHSSNRVFPMEENAVFPEKLHNSTYWWNEYLHVGHFFYEMVLFQALATSRIDRVVIQRAACNGNSCAGIGSIDSYYKGFFGIAFEAFGQPDIPVYLRYTWQQKEVSPVYFSVHTQNFYNENNRTVEDNNHRNIPLREYHCFDHMYRRSPKISNTYGAIIPISLDVIEQFRSTAYRVINSHVRRFGLESSEFSYFRPPSSLAAKVKTPLPVLNYTELSAVFPRDHDHSYHLQNRNRNASMHSFSNYSSSKNHRSFYDHNHSKKRSYRVPKRILVAFRGESATRFITNLELLIDALQQSFPAPTYEIALLDTSNPKLGFKEQLHAVASSYVVISNHGAFEGNMIYMRKGSLLVELFGRYGNNEVHAFHRLSMALGLFYTRLNPENMVEHQQKSFAMTESDVRNVTVVMQEYFQRRAYRMNMI